MHSDSGKSSELHRHSESRDVSTQQQGQSEGCQEKQLSQLQFFICAMVAPIVLLMARLMSPMLVVYLTAELNDGSAMFMVVSMLMVMARRRMVEMTPTSTPLMFLYYRAHGDDDEGKLIQVI